MIHFFNLISKMLFILILINNRIVLSQITYYGIDGFGKLTIDLDKKSYYFNLVDDRIDSGRVQKSGDTLILNSYKMPVSSIKDKNVIKNICQSIPNFFILYEDNKASSNKRLSLDTISLHLSSDIPDQYILIIENKDIKPNSFVTLYSLLPGEYLSFEWKYGDSKKNAIYLSVILNNPFWKIYFNNFKLIPFDNYLLPDGQSVLRFMYFNNDILIGFKKGSSNDPYKTIKSFNDLRLHRYNPRIINSALDVWYKSRYDKRSLE